MLNWRNIHFDRHGFAVVYIGDYHENFGRPKAKAGFGVYFEEKSSLNRSAALTGFARVNNIGIGVIRAANTAIYVAALNGYRRLCIRTDSMYLLESVLRKMGKWKRCGWIGSDGRPVENMPDFKELSRTIDRYGIQLKWRYTSVNHHCIKCAVKLATQSAKIYKIYSSQHA